MAKHPVAMRDRYFLLVLMIPLFCGIVIDLVVGHGGGGSTSTVYFEALLKNISWFAIGLTLLFNPDVLIRATLTQLLTRGVNRTKLGWTLRIFGVLLVVLASFSSQFLVKELLRNVP